jgi:hypothetical protein
MKQTVKIEQNKTDTRGQLLCKTRKNPLSLAVFSLPVNLPSGIILVRSKIGRGSKQIINAFTAL